MKKLILITGILMSITVLSCTKTSKQKESIVNAQTDLTLEQKK